MTGMVLGTMMGGGGGISGGQGNRKTVQLDNNYNFPVVALKALTEYQPSNYEFNLDGRTLFDAKKVKGIKVLNGDVGEEVAKNQAKTLVDQLQSHRAHEQYHMIQSMTTDSDLGEAVTAVVVARAGHALSEGELLSALKSEIAGFKVPKHVHFVADLPRNAMGKVQKNVLRETFSRRSG